MLLSYIKKLINKKKWRNLNKNNYTIYKDVFGDMNRVHIGNYTYGEIYVSSPNPNCELFIGNFCSIAGDVRFLLGADHSVDKISTYPFKAKMFEKGIDAITKGNIIVDDDVWIGQGAIILSGVHIGQGAVIAAGAVVTSSVPPYAIVGGVPARVIKYRFSSDIIRELLNVDYSKLTRKIIEKNINYFYEIVTDRRQFDWMPKKTCDSQNDVGLFSNE